MITGREGMLLYFNGNIFLTTTTMYVPESSYVEIHYSNVNYVGEGKII